ncbi:PREDICTED: multiple coagulation factor deficiency protein 2 homolog isoform X2 [Priapulus caudatus]|uniref:Multiple coagulation factor deficiency protein 2 homolog isoform X2 n=1 Tax=Priapulus caudatus TaxID=37621 RepID=A0ABM1E7W5_PRICU|nr:PREDICTED: multiple coagulation factor deficiency protein 2 homolog isoform X2 [Priapulus caudatus]
MDWFTRRLLDICLIVSCSVVFVISHGQHRPAKHNIDDLQGTNRFRDKEFVQDREHVKEHLKDLADIDEEKMTPEELEFHYFKLHDFDNNTKLDGLEILAALTHAIPWEEQDEKDASGLRKDPAKIKELQDDRLRSYVDIIDIIMDEDDTDGDGYLTYYEFMVSRRKGRATPIIPSTIS